MELYIMSSIIRYRFLSICFSKYYLKYSSGYKINSVVNWKYYERYQSGLITSYHKIYVILILCLLTFLYT